MSRSFSFFLLLLIVMFTSISSFIHVFVFLFLFFFFSSRRRHTRCLSDWSSDVCSSDLYSSAEFSERQNGYAQVFGSNQVYTPQMIVDGRTEFVGSSEGRARQAILQEAQAPKAAVYLRWAPIPSGQARDLAAAKSAALGIPLDVRVEELGETATGDTPEVYLAITESNLHSEVLRGENAGSRFDHFAVVRELRPIGKANPRVAIAFAAQPMVTLAPNWKRENLRAVVFVQERRSRRGARLRGAI